MSQSNNSRFSGQSHCAINNRSALPSATDYFQQIGTPLREHSGSHYAPCPWAGGRTCPTHGSVKVDLQTGAFQCPLCAPDGGDTLTYHRLANCLTHALAFDALTVTEA